MPKTKISSNVFKLSDAVQTEINCEYCNNSFGSYSDVLDCAEAADAEGWVVNKAGKVKCPDCVNLMSKVKILKKKKASIQRPDLF